MAKGKKTGGRDASLSNTLSADGRTKQSALTKAIRIESKETVAKLYWDCLNLNNGQMEARIADPLVTLFERNVLYAIVKDIGKGRVQTIQMLTERVLGRPKEYIDLTASVNIDSAIDTTKLTPDELDTLLMLMNKGKVSRTYDS